MLCSELRWRLKGLCNQFLVGRLLPAFTEFVIARTRLLLPITIGGAMPLRRNDTRNFNRSPDSARRCPELLPKGGTTVADSSRLPQSLQELEQD